MGKSKMKSEGKKSEGSKQRRPNPSRGKLHPRQKDHTGSGYGMWYFVDCLAKGMAYKEARKAILEDKADAGDWARRVNERQIERAWAAAVKGRGVTLDDFYAFLPNHTCIFVPTREPWLAESVNAVIPPIGVGKDKISASMWLARNKPVMQRTWAPGEDMLIRDRLVDSGGWIERAGSSCFNLYRPPAPLPGDPEKAAPWRDLLREVYPDEAEHIESYFAFKVQNPGVKINHALLLGGAPGIGKDTILEGFKRAVGHWNFKDITPHDLFAASTDFRRTVVLRINEACDLGDTTRFEFYERLKIYCAAPPDVLRVNEKYIPPYWVFNVCGVIITTNHKMDGLYLPADDRRTHVSWSDLKQEDFTEEDYLNKLWHWYENEGGYGHVAAYLARRDVGGFNPKAPPLKTRHFWAIVDVNRAPEDAELADVLDRLGNPAAVTLEQVTAVAKKTAAGFYFWLRERKNRRAIPHRFEKCGYESVANDLAKDGLWKLAGKRQTIYARSTLLPVSQLAAARRLADEKS
jgi:hypothetical protein